MGLRCKPVITVKKNGEDKMLQKIKLTVLDLVVLSLYSYLIITKQAPVLAIVLGGVGVGMATFTVVCTWVQPKFWKDR